MQKQGEPNFFSMQMQIKYNVIAKVPRILQIIAHICKGDVKANIPMYFAVVAIQILFTKVWPSLNTSVGMQDSLLSKQINGANQCVSLVEQISSKRHPISEKYLANATLYLANVWKKPPYNWEISGKCHPISGIYLAANTLYLGNIWQLPPYV